MIDQIRQRVKIYHPSTLKGIGDDAAVFIHQDQESVVSTDLLLEGVHFDLMYTPLKHLGYKAIAVNVSDIAAMNAIPRQVTVSIGLSNRFSLEDVQELYEGIFAACDNYQVDLVGGDTSSSRSGLVISVTAIGAAPKELLVYRNGAKPGDIICCTGDLGGAYMGLQVLEREKQVFLADQHMQPQLEPYDYVVHRQLKPEARMDIIHEFRELGLVPTSMIDVSDGLASELLHLARASHVGAKIYEEKIPIGQPTWQVAADEFKIPVATCALNGGEDYELLFTISQSDYEKIKLHPDISFIGYIDEASKGVKMVTRGEQLVDITAQGWNHF